MFAKSWQTTVLCQKNLRKKNWQTKVHDLYLPCRGTVCRFLCNKTRHIKIWIPFRIHHFEKVFHYGKESNKNNAWRLIDNVFYTTLDQWVYCCSDDTQRLIHRSQFKNGTVERIIQPLTFGLQRYMLFHEQTSKGLNLFKNG